LLGMISTHWNYPHTPSERHLYLLDVLARQAADLIERTQTEEALKESEESLRTLTAQLEERVNERTLALQRSNADLQQFAHVASHDLKEPVRKITTYSLRLEDELNGHATENARRYTKKILESAGRMSTMIEGVLTYSSLNAIHQNMAPVDLNGIIADINNDLEVLIDQSGARIQSEPLPKVEGIQVLLYQLFYNLINNSLKFSKKDQPPVIKITCERTTLDDADHVKIILADNGIGFEPAYNQQIFNSFMRLNSKSDYDGTGLGLSLAKKIVERHQGTIQADGIMNEGAVFTIALPIKQAIHQK
jgi:light-regulated signal transduction histidine kinase (bacteriophytochrome)